MRFSKNSHWDDIIAYNIAKLDTSGTIARSRVNSLDGVVDSLGRVVDSLDGIVDSLGSW